MPPILNGQVKTPLRAYPKAHMPIWASQQCKGLAAERPYPVLSFPNEIPAFQFLAPASTAVPSAWVVYSLTDGVSAEVADISNALEMLLQEQLAEGDQFIFFGGQVGAVLPESLLYWQITFDDGSIWTSELFKPGFSGEGCALIVSGEEAFTSEFDDLIGWGVGSSGNEADEETNVAGAPADPTPFLGKKFVNTADEKLYTYNGTIWVQSTPSPGDYRLVASTGVWYEFSGGAWVVMSTPPFTVGDFGACQGTNPDGLSLTRTGLDTDAGIWYLRIDVGPFVHGYLTVGLGASVTQAVLYPGVHILEFETPGADAEFFILPSSNFDGCINSVRIYSGVLAPRCNIGLEWSACGDIGRTRYLSGFVNRFILPSGVGDGVIDVQIPRIAIDIGASENGDGDTIQNRGRKEVEWSLDFGLVPWHIADAISEAAVGGTLRMLHKEGLGADELLDVRVDQSWDEGDSCACRLILFFKVDDASVATGCCDGMELACLEPCQEVIDIVLLDAVGLTPGMWYAIEDRQAVALAGEDGELGHPDRCDSGIIEVTGEDIPRYFDPLTSTWLPLAVITSVTCVGDCDDGIMIVTADVMPGRRAVLQYSADGSTWVNSDLDLPAEEWAANTIEVEVAGPFIRLEVYTTDCIMGHTASQMVPCDDGSYQYQHSNSIVMANPGSGFFRVNSAVDASITQVAISDTDFGGNDRQAYWDGATGQIVISQPGAGTEELVLNITAVAGAGTHHIIDVVYVAGEINKAFPGCCVRYREA